MNGQANTDLHAFLFHSNHLEMNIKICSSVLSIMISVSNLLIADEELTLFSSSLHEGNQSYTGSLGRVLEIKEKIKVMEIGAFESNPNGPFSIKVAIYDNNTKDLVSGSKIFSINRENSKWRKQFRFIKIEPLSLSPGSYMLVAQGYNNDQQNGNTGLGGSGPGVNGGDCISVGASAFGAESISYPNSPDGNVYHAANIVFVKETESSSDSFKEKTGSSIIRRRN